MGDTHQKDKDMLEAVRRGDTDAWARLVDAYQGRLLRFARGRLPQHADAEDAVQETFASFVKAIPQIQIEVGIETYLFGILRHEIVNRFRSRLTKTVCLLQDVYHTGSDDALINALDQIVAGDPSVSWCVGRDEQQQLQQRTLARALDHLVAGFRDKGKLRNLKIAELLFYCKLPNREVAKLLGLKNGLIRVIKHRCLKQIRDDVIQFCGSADVSFSYSEDLLTEVWESHRLSCPKRSTLGAFLLETLPPKWFDYVDFHLTTVGCHFCRASYKDLQERQNGREQERFRQRIMTSTIGFLSSKP
jgi:RNA polymerase sigma-70 factor, ECF subfamily